MLIILLGLQILANVLLKALTVLGSSTVEFRASDKAEFPFIYVVNILLFSFRGFKLNKVG